MPGVPGPARLLATTVSGQNGRATIVVGALLRDRDRALSVLALLLVLGGSGALLLAGGVGFGLSTVALRTVESMRRRAQTISVELRTPMAVLRAELEIALRGQDSVAELRAALASAFEETSRVSQLVDDLLILARADQGKLPLRWTPVLVGDLLDRVAERFRAQAEAAGRSLTVMAMPELQLPADQARLEQALGNMVENALRHGSGPIVLSGAPANEVVEIHVTDEGPGLSPGFVDVAFERFARADPGRTAEGSGLGLAIVRSIARAHRGEAHAANRRLGGADMWLIPQRHSAAGIELAQASRLGAPSHEASSGGPVQPPGRPTALGHPLTRDASVDPQELPTLAALAPHWGQARNRASYDTRAAGTRRWTARALPT